MANSNDGFSGKTGGKTSDVRQHGTIDEALRALDAALCRSTASITEIASEDFGNIKTAVSELSSQVIENAVDALGSTGEAIKDMGRQSVIEFAKVAKEAASEVSRQSSEAFREADRQMRANPWPFIGAAAFGAFLGGVVVSVYMHSQKESGQ